MNTANPKVDGFIRKNKQWAEVLEALRRILRDSPLTEEVKWRAPCYTLEGRNVAMLGAFKACCVLSFMKGALLRDPRGILVKPGENTQAGRVIRFTEARQVADLEPLLKSLVAQAIAVEKAGLKVTLKKPSEYVLPEELRAKMKQMPALKTAFEALTPGRRRAYLLHFSGAKQSKTRASRIDKWAPHILAGKGLNDE